MERELVSKPLEWLERITLEFTLLNHPFQVAELLVKLGFVGDLIE